jgi:hypothetical protein
MNDSSLIVGRQLNIEIMRGDSLTQYNAKFLVTDETGAAVDLTGYDDARFVLTNGINTTPVLTGTKVAGEVVLGNGFWNLNFEDGDDVDIPATKYEWQLKVIVTATNEEYTIGYGRCNVVQNSVN